jgi:hypothetical protein
MWQFYYTLSLLLCLPAHLLLYEPEIILCLAL